MAELSPIQMIAGAALANNQGLQITQAMTDAVLAYNTSIPVATFVAVLGTAVSANLSNATIQSLRTIASNSCPALASSYPAEYSAQLLLTFEGSTAGFIGDVYSAAESYLGNGNLGVFAQVFGAAVGYVKQTNEFITSSNNGDQYQGSNFTNMNSLITGSLTDVNLATNAFGTDMSKIGSLFNLAKLIEMGTPSGLILQLSVVSGLSVASTINGILPTVAISLESENYQLDNIETELAGDVSVSVPLQQLIYQGMTRVTGDELVQVLELLQFNLDDRTEVLNRLTNLADLLNPVKLFPNSFASLTLKTFEGNRAIYANNSDTVNSNLLGYLPNYLIPIYEELAKIVPSGQALATIALQASFGQIKNISEMSVPQLAQAFTSQETTKDLPLIANLTQPVPQNVKDYYNENFATGTGPDGTLVLTDVLGASIGIGYVDELANVVVNIQEIASSIPGLSGVYTMMLDTNNGVYGNPVTGPVNIPDIGIFVNADSAYSTALISSAQEQLAGVVETFPAQTTAMNLAFDNIGNLIVNETNNAANAGIVIGDIETAPVGRGIIMSFVQSLDSYAQDVGQNGPSQFLQQLANLETQGGQAVVAAMRAGRNIARLAELGVGQDIAIPSTTSLSPPNTSLLDSSFSESEAANSVVK
jgi:hypothetical protein